MFAAFPGCSALFILALSVSALPVLCVCLEKKKKKKTENAEPAGRYIGSGLYESDNCNIRKYSIHVGLELVRYVVGRQILY